LMYMPTKYWMTRPGSKATSARRQSFTARTSRVGFSARRWGAACHSALACVDPARSNSDPGWPRQTRTSLAGLDHVERLSSETKAGTLTTCYKSVLGCG
jgi:hypothetical protein